EKAGVVNGLSRIIAAIFGTNIIFGLLILLFCCGIISTVIPSLPLVVAMLPLLKEYIVSVGLATSSFLSSNFQGQLSVEALLLFYAMLFGVTLGGNGTAVGGISNVIAVNYSEREGSRISLKDFLHYGIPVMLLQLVVIALYLLVRFIV
ncbi:MAG: transporter, partial [Cyanobacteria bacterium J06639_18]